MVASDDRGLPSSEREVVAPKIRQGLDKGRIGHSPGGGPAGSGRGAGGVAQRVDLELDSRVALEDGRGGNMWQAVVLPPLSLPYDRSHVILGK